MVVIKPTKPPRLVDFIFDIFQKIGSRTAGSREEKLAARYLKSVLNQYTDEVTIETFKCCQRNVQQNINFLCICYCLALMGYLVSDSVTFFITILALIDFGLLRFFEINIFDILAGAKSQNVIAKLKPKGEVKSLLIFTSHLDSPYLMKIYEQQFREYHFILKNTFIGCFILLFLISLLQKLMLIPSLIDYLYFLSFLCLGFIVYYQQAMITYQVSFGANFNLSGTSILVGLTKHFSINRLKNTEVWFCTFGSQSTDYTGAKKFLEIHRERLNENTRIINIEAVAGGGLYIIDKEPETSFEYDSGLNNLFLDSAKELKIPLDIISLKGIRTNAGTFLKKKIKCTSIITLDDKGIPLRYFSKEDLPQYISEEQLQESYKICIKVTEKIDEGPKTKQTKAKKQPNQ